MISDLINEKEFTKRIAKWILENDKSVPLKSGDAENEYICNFRLPDFDYAHTQSYADENGDLITLLKSGIYLRDWETKNGREPKKIEFYKILRTSTDTPEVEPFPMGYIIVL